MRQRTAPAELSHHRPSEEFQMLFFKKILCPIDLDDDTSLSALSYASGLAEQNNATLYLLHVARIPGPDMDAPVAIAPHPHWEMEAQRKLETIGRQRLDAKVAYEVIVRGGIPESVIVELAVELGIDLIVMATHGRSGLAHLILGSVAEAVIREAPCPVLTLRPRRVEKDHAGATGDSRS
jgi:universal stress protein A